MCTRRFLFQGLIGLLLAGMAHAQAFPARVLFVGNSYFYYNNGLHNRVKSLLLASGALPPGLNIEYKLATIGGSALHHQPIEWLTEPGRIGVKAPFEVVLLAGNSTDALHARSAQQFHDAVLKFAPIIRARGGQPVLYMTHAHVAPHRQASPQALDKIVAMYRSAGQAIGAEVLPVALAFEASYRRAPQIRLHDAHDGSHPSVLGTYLAACVVLAQLYGIHPVGNPDRAAGQVPPEVALHLQQVAWDVVSEGRTAQR